MIEDGLFRDHPVEEVFAVHNWPGLTAGEISARPGAQMAGYDTFEISISGKSRHAAMPHDCYDSIVAAGQLVVALQLIVSRSIDPQAPAVLGVTQIHGADALNIIPQDVKLAGCTRYFDKEAQRQLCDGIKRICAGIEMQYNIVVTVDYKNVYPATINDSESVGKGLDIATNLLGMVKIHADQNPSMASEDFAFMLGEKPGAYLWVGNGPIDMSGALHTPTYDFNDEIIPIGAQFFALLIEETCSVQ